MLSEFLEQKHRKVEQRQLVSLLPSSNWKDEFAAVFEIRTKLVTAILASVGLLSLGCSTFERVGGFKLKYMHNLSNSSESSSRSSSGQAVPLSGLTPFFGAFVKDRGKWKALLSSQLSGFSTFCISDEAFADCFVAVLLFVALLSWLLLEYTISIYWETCI